MLCLHEAVTNAAVILHSPIPSDPAANQLIAFVECEAYNADDVALLLRSHVANLLPSCIHRLIHLIYLFFSYTFAFFISGKSSFTTLRHAPVHVHRRAFTQGN